jgi:serralysin
MADTVPSDVTSTAVVPIGGSLYGTIETNGDHDWYRVNLAAGQTYQFRLHGMGTGQLRDPTLVLRDSTGAPLFLNDDAGASRWGNSNSLDSFIQYTASSSGTYFLDVGDLGDNETGNFLLSAVANNSAGMVFTNDEIAWQIVNNYNESSVGGSNSRPFAWNVGPGGALSPSTSPR